MTSFLWQGQDGEPGYRRDRGGPDVAADRGGIITSPGWGQGVTHGKTGRLACTARPRLLSTSGAACIRRSIKPGRDRGVARPGGRGYRN